MSRKYKLSLIYCLLYGRIWYLEDDRQVEIRKLEAIFKQNKYTNEIIDHEINKYFKNGQSKPKKTL